MRFRPCVEALGDRVNPTQLWAVPVDDGFEVVEGDDTAPYAAMDPLYIDPNTGSPVLRLGNGNPIAPLKINPPEPRSAGPYTEWGIQIGVYTYWAWKNNQPEGG